MKKFNPNDYNLSGMDDKVMYTMMQHVMVVTMLKQSVTDIPAELIRRFGAHPDQITADFIERLGCVLYFMSLILPYPLMKIGGIEVAYQAMLSPGNSVTPDSLAAKLSRTFKDFSPAMSAAITPDVMRQVGRLLLLDWLHNGIPDEKHFRFDMHFYLDAILDLDTDLDREQVKREAALNLDKLSPDEIAGLDPDTLEEIRLYQAQNRKNDQTGE